MWNHRLLSPVFGLEEPHGHSRWVLPLIHGFMDQASEPSPHGRVPLVVGADSTSRDQRLYPHGIPDINRPEIETLCGDAIPYERSKRACKFMQGDYVLRF